MKLNGVMLGTEDAKKLSDFYTSILGQPAWNEGEWFGYSVGGMIMIGPHSEVKGTNQVPGRIMIIFETESLQDDFVKIRDLGATVVAEPYQPSKEDAEMWLATFSDPDGNYFQLATPMKQ